MTPLPDDVPSEAITKRIFDLLESELPFDWDKPVHENWFGKLLIKLRLKSRRYEVPEFPAFPKAKTIRVIRYSRLKLPQEDTHE